MSYNQDNTKKKNLLISVIVTIVLIAIIIFLIVSLVRRQNTISPADPTDSVSSPTAADQTPTANPPTQSLEIPATPEVSASAPATPTPISPDYNYRYPVPKSEFFDMDHFKNAVFIGDSRMEDFGLFTGMARYATFYTHVGLTINHIISDDSSKLTKFKVNGESLTLIEALSRYSNFDKIYIMLGYNELGWPYPETFIQYYVKLIDKIKAINPNAAIYIECIIPVARQISGSGVNPETENNYNIGIFNEHIKNMCAEQKVYYLNVQEAVVDSNGFLPDGAANDGIHLKKEYCLKWLEYIQTHVVRSGK